jgi:glycerol uptake facilitator protein
MRTGMINRLTAELVGTLLLVFFVVTSLVAAVAAGIGTVGAALAQAFALALIVWLFGAISGAHVNPAVTIAMAARGRLPWLDAVLYLVAQLVGGFLGALVAWATYGSTGIDAGLGASHVAGEASPGAALVAEIVGGFLLVLTVYALAVHERVPAGFAGLAIGLALGASILAVGAISGSSLNFARTLGPELVLAIGGGAAEWGNIWVYAVGPVVGGLLAVFGYDYLIRSHTSVSRRA